MTLLISLILVVGHVFLAQGASSPKAKPAAKSPTWNEPTDFPGLRVGDDVTQALPECPKRPSGVPGLPSCYPTLTFSGESPKCWMREPYAEPGLYEINGYSILEPFQFGQVRAYQLEGRLERLDIPVNITYNDFEALVTVLKTRYGPPTRESREAWQKRLGAVFSSRVFIWQGQQVSMVLRERGNTVDVGRLTSLTARWIRANSAQEQEQILKGAKGLSAREGRACGAG